MNNKNTQPTPLNETLAMSDEVRTHEINQLEKLFNADSAPEPPLPEVTIDNTDPTKSYTRREKLRANTSEAGLFMAATGLAGKIASRLRDGRARREQKYEVHEGDSRIKKVGKFLGRNALRIAGLSVVAGASYINVKNGIDAWTTPDSAPIDQITTMPEIKLTADTRMLVGGHFDKNAAGLDGIMNNLQGHGANQTIRIDYPAEIAPYPGETHTLDQSTQIASDKIYNAYKSSNGKSLELIGYSQGTQGVQHAANRIAAENGGVLPDNVKVLLVATPNGESGFFNSPYAQAASPILDGMGIDVNQPIPKGAKVIAMDTDFWANSGDKPVTTMISQLIGLAGDGHNPPVDGMRSTTEVVDGNTYTTYYHNNGPQTAALRVLEQKTDIPVTAAMDKFGQAIAPQGSMGVETNISATEVIDASADLAKEGLGDRGLLTPEVENGINQLENLANGQHQGIQQTLDTVQSIPNQIVETFTPPVATPSGNIETLVPPVAVEQVRTQVNNVVDQVQTIAPPEIQSVIDQSQQQINSTFNNIINNNFSRR